MTLKIRRGTNSQRQTITPESGEPIYTTDTKKLFIGDGSTPGGVDVDTDTGEDNTNSNATTPGTNEAGLVNTKSGVDTPIKVIKGGSNVTVVQNANDVTISATGGGGGSGSGVTFLSTQTEYDSQVWSAGDIFIPTADMEYRLLRRLL